MPLQRQALGLFTQQQVITTQELADYLGLSARQERDQWTKWLDDGFLVVANASKKGRSYRLAERFEILLV